MTIRSHLRPASSGFGAWWVIQLGGLPIFGSTARGQQIVPELSVGKRKSKVDTNPSPPYQVGSAKGRSSGKCAIFTRY